MPGEFAFRVVVQPFDAGGFSRQYVERQGCRIAECLDGVGEFFVGVTAIGCDHVPERIRFWRFGLAVEVQQIVQEEQGGDVCDATRFLPRPKRSPVFLRELLAAALGEFHVVSAIVRWQDQRVTVVGGDDHSGAV
jgi:hypothetical protein